MLKLHPEKKSDLAIFKGCVYIGAIICDHLLSRANYERLYKHWCQSRSEGMFWIHDKNVEYAHIGSLWLASKWADGMTNRTDLDQLFL